MAIDWSQVIGAATPISYVGGDPDEAAASGDVPGYIAAKQAGVPYQAKPGVTRTTMSDTSALPPKPYATGVSRPPNDGNVTSISSPQPANNAPNPPSEAPSGGAVPSTVTPSGGGGRAGFSDTIRQSLGQKQQILSQPLAAGPDINKIEAQEVAARGAAPDPGASQFRPSIGRRIARGVEGVGLGLAEGGLRGAVAGGIAPQTTGLSGYSDPNSAFFRAKQANDQTVAGLDQQLKAAQEQQTSANDINKNTLERASQFGSLADQATKAQTAQDKPTGKAQIITAGDGSLFSVDPDNPTHPTPITGPDGKPIMGKGDGKYVQLEIGGKPHTVEVDDKGNTIKDLGPTGEKPTNIHVGEGGTWSLQEQKDAQGNTKTVLMNSKTGDIKDAPAGIQKIGTSEKAQAAQAKITEPIDGALSYANDYMQRINQGIKPTGSDDEALMEKYFELAKPSTGFRMTQPQIDMLNHAQGLMTGIEAKARHLATGSYYTNAQRKEIISTMNSLAKAKKDAIGKAGGATNSQSPDGPAKPAAKSSGGFNWDDHPKVNP